MTDNQRATALGSITSDAGHDQIVDAHTIHGLPLNRAIFDENTGELLDAIAGNFFIVGTPEDSDSFQSLSTEQEMKYSKLFRYPEHISMEFGKIVVEKYKPTSKENER